MRKFILAVIAVTAAGAAALVTSLATSAPAAARDYPWCVQGKGVGYPGDCSYTSRAQCMASASGRLATCGLNPRLGYGRQRGRSVYRGDY
jgi:hypothetical protein